MRDKLEPNLNLGDVGPEGELEGGDVADADGVGGLGSVDDDVEAVEDTVVGEDLKGLLVVVGGVEDLDLGVELAEVGLEEDLGLLDGGVEGDGVDGSSALDVGALDLVGEVVAEVGERGLGVGGRAGDGELVRAGVLDLDGGLLVAGADDALEGTLVAVVRVGLHGHGGPVGADPELDVGVHGTAIGGHVDLDELLVDVGELPGATGLAEDALLVTDVGGLGGGAEGGSPVGTGGADVEGGGGAAGLLGGEGGGGTGEEGGEGELHLDYTNYGYGKPR